MKLTMGKAWEIPVGEDTLHISTYTHKYHTKVHMSYWRKGNNYSDEMSDFYHFNWDLIINEERATKIAKWLLNVQSNKLFGNKIF